MCECEIGKNNLILFRDAWRDCDKYENKSDDIGTVKRLEHLLFTLCRIFIHTFTNLNWRLVNNKFKKKWNLDFLQFDKTYNN